MAIGICCIAVIFMQACASSINYSVYSLNQEISVLEGDIDNLHVQLNSYAALDYVESYATENLGMIYPEAISMSMFPIWKAARRWRVI